MERRDFLKLGTLSSSSLLGVEWLFTAQSASAATPEISSKNGILQATLVAEETMVPYENGKRWAMTYNGVVPGPTLRARPGDELRISLVNKLKEPTNLHTHGLHASPDGNSDNPFLLIEPGEKFDYLIKIPKNQMSGTFWFHPHHHHLSARQVASGMAGTLIVEDQLDDMKVISESSERVLVLSDPRIGDSSIIAETSQMDLMHGRTGPNTLINGLLLPSFKAIGDKPERWRIVNACASEYQTISIKGCTIHQLSTDSARLPKLRKVQSVTLTPGQRTEILVSAPKKGSYTITNSLQTIGRIIFPTKSLPVKLTSLLPFKAISKADRQRSIKVVGGGMGAGMGVGAGSGMGSGMGGESFFTFDGKAFDPDRIDQKVNFGSVEDWVITNPSNMSHPFHIHVWPFQVVDDGTGKALIGWRDTVNLPARSTVTIRIPFVGIRGKTVYHCHILDHEDMGMMGTVLVS